MTQCSRRKIAMSRYVVVEIKEDEGGDSFVKCGKVE